jgi:transcriptional regulator with XRE-family HTH domain
MSTSELAARLLRIWMAAEHLKVAALARRLGCSREHLSNLRSGKSAPGRSLALKLERESGGAVPAASWDEPVAA